MLPAAHWPFSCSAALTDFIDGIDPGQAKMRSKLSQAVRRLPDRQPSRFNPDQIKVINHSFHNLQMRKPSGSRPQTRFYESLARITVGNSEITINDRENILSFRHITEYYFAQALNQICSGTNPVSFLKHFKENEDREF
jgi:hypothetical protein